MGFVSIFLKGEKMKFLVIFIGLLMSNISIADVSSKLLAKNYILKVTPNVESISPEELKIRISANEDDFVLLDVRTFKERNSSKTIFPRGEVHIPRGMLEIKAWHAVPKDKEIVVYCAKGSRGRLATQTLLDMGWEDVSNLSGGIEAYYKSLDSDCGCSEQSIINVPKM